MKMKKNLYCLSCDEIRECNLKENKITKTIDGITITYLEKKYICSVCGEVVYDAETFDYNIHTANDELRKHTGLIRTSEIQEIIDKYSISQKNLSKVLGFGEIQISRYLKSGNPSRAHSDILKSIKDNPFVFEGYLLNAKDILDEKTFRKQLGKVRQLELLSNHSKIYDISVYLMEHNPDTTNMSLQKILYFLNGFSKKFLKYNLFNDLAQAWIHGPVYPEIYDALSYYFNNKIDVNEILKDKEIDLSEEEINYINNVSKFFSCYSGSKLRDMSHLTDPWINARKGLSEEEPSNRIIDNKDIENYFSKVIKDYNIETVDDVNKYAQDLFNKVLDN